MPSSLIPRLLTTSGCAVAALAMASGAARGATPVPNPVTGGGALPVVKHVWTIVLENSEEEETIASDTVEGNGELTQTLAGQGAFITNYFATGHSSLDNYIALAAAQGPTPQTQGDCNDDLNPIGGDRLHARFDADGQALGLPEKIAAGKAGCTYPADVPTLATQLTRANYTWKTYAQGMDSVPSLRRTTCQSAQYAGQRNSTAPNSTFADNYARKHDPELYFYGVTGTGATPDPGCDASEVGLGQLVPDLASTSTAPSYSLIVPDLCNDAHDFTCKANSAGPDGLSRATTSGIPQADLFLQEYVPKILASPAFKDAGLLMITFDEGSLATACCGEVHSPNLPAGTDNGSTAYLAGTPVPTGTVTGGGGQVGMVAISPFITPGTRSTVPYNHYSYVRTMEDLFRLTPARTGIAGSDGLGHIGYAGSQGGSPANAPQSMGEDVFTNVSAAEPVADLPESRVAVLLPISGILLGAGVYTRRRRRATASAA